MSDAPAKAKARKKPAGNKKKKRGKKKRTLTEADLIEALLSVELLADLPEASLVELAGAVKHHDLDPEDKVGLPAAPRAEPASLFVVLKGELKIRAQAGGEWKLANIVPRGEFFFDRAVDPTGGQTLELTAIQPTQALELPYANANSLLTADPAFKDRFMSVLQAATARKQDFFEADSVAEIAGFLGEHRLMGLQRLKAKRLDKCIDCDGCFEACAQRHGVSRIGDYKAKFGLVGVPYNCHNCESPGCVPKCKFGHIGYADSGEIQISDDCTGCTQCFRGCSYGSITMVPLDAMPEGYLSRSEGAKGKQVARKCDDCSGFQDQACISACPTGAIFQVSSTELADYLSIFVKPDERAEGTAAQLANIGGAVSVEKPPWGGWRYLFMAGVTLVSLILAWEALGRGWFQDLTAKWFSFTAALYQLDIRSAQPETGEYALRPGNPFSLLVGYLGAYAMILSQLYRVRRSVGPRMGSMRVWMEFHIHCGYLGGIFILFHALKPAWSFFWNRWFLIAFVPMCIAIATGVLGRYAWRLTGGSKSESGEGRTPEQIDAALAEVDRRIETIVKTPDGFNQAVSGATMVARIDVDSLQQFENAARVKEGLKAVKGVAPAVPGALEDDGTRLGKAWWAIRALRASLKARFAGRKAMRKLKADVQGMANLTAPDKKALLEALAERVELERSRSGFDVFDKLQNSWMVIHTSASYLMFATMMIHVVYEWIFLGKRAFRP